MTSKNLKMALMATAVGFVPTQLVAQQAAQPAGQGQLPPVDVIQKQKAAPAKKSAAKAAPKKKAAPAAAPAPEPVEEFVETQTGPTRAENGQVVTNAAPVTSPVVPTGIIPEDLSGFAGAASRVTTSQIDAQRPISNHEALTRVPGVAIINDDGLGRQGGVSVRGSPARRNRKVLTTEDGDSINFSTYLDPSLHYTPPTDRVESIEVLRGTVVTHGPLNNHGIINYRNLNPFGTAETVISAAITHTEGADEDIGNMRHLHHRQQIGNFGFVFSYSGAEVGGSWDSEQTEYNDLYTALGWKDSQQELILSAVYHAQRDRYDESNLLPEEFARVGRDRSKVDPNAQFNNYNSDIVRLQAAHTYFLDPDTTISSRIYGFYNDRPRFEADSEYADDENPQLGEEFVMEGRERVYRHVGAESRIEFANRPFIAGMTQDIQIGARYEYHDFRNVNKLGEENQILSFDTRGSFPAGLAETYEAQTVAGFLQSAIHLSRDWTVTPGVRFEYYDVDRVTRENEDLEDVEFPFRETVDYAHVLPGIAFAYDGFYNSTVYGGYHRGLTPHVLRGEVLGSPSELGDNFQIGFRSTAFTGLTFDVAYFHSDIENYQIKEPFTTEDGNNIFGNVDEVEIDGVELYGRLDSRPFTGGPWNFFGEVTYTFADSIIRKGDDITEDGDVIAGAFDGNKLPEVPRHFAALTAGIQHQSGWDISATATYRGSFFADSANSSQFLCEVESDNDEEAIAPCANPGLDSLGDPFEAEEVVGGFVDDVWLLSARANYNIPGTGATLFVSGQNLLDELYITDLADGVKPGIGRTVFGGVKIKLD